MCKINDNILLVRSINRKYNQIHHVLGEELLMSKMQEDKAKILPLYFANTFTLREGKLLGRSLIFAIQKTNEYYTPDQYKNIIGQLSI